MQIIYYYVNCVNALICNTIANVVFIRDPCLLREYNIVVLDDQDHTFMINYLGTS